MRYQKLFSAACAAAALVLAGCATASPPDTDHATASRYDQHLHDLLPADIRAHGSLRIVTDASYAPAESYAADGRTIVGFEPDLIALLGKVLGIRIELVNASFDTVLDAVAKHQDDLAVSSITDTTGRESEVDFVNYFTAGSSIVVQRGNPQGILDLRDLCGKAVAVETSTIQVDLLARAQRQCSGPRITEQVYPTNSDALLQLRTGRVVAVLNDYTTAAFLATDPKTRAFYQLSSDTQYEPGPYGIAVAKDRSGLRDAIRDAVDRIIRSGDYQEVLRRWAVAAGAVQSASINAGGTGT